MESGRLIVTIGARRWFADGPAVNYGYRTGQLIPLTVVISADPELQIDLGALYGKKLNKDGSQFELAAPPVVTSEERNGKRITIIQLVVRSWVMESALRFNCQFHYATELLPDGKPAWKLATTPDYIISTSRTATASSTELLSGDMSQKKTPTAWWAQPLKFGGAFVMALVPLWLAIRFVVIWRNADKTSRAQKAWRVIEGIDCQRRRAGKEEFTRAQLRTIAATLRGYLGIQSLPTQYARTPLEQFFAAVSGGSASEQQREELVAVCLRALAKLDRAIYSQSRLTREETGTLMQEIGRVIPRQ